MKIFKWYIIAISLLLSQNVFAQPQAGFKFGINTSGLNFNSYGETQRGTGFVAGHFREWSLAGGSSDFLKLTVEFNFALKEASINNLVLQKYITNYSWDGHSYRIGDLEYNNYFIQLPVLFKYEHPVNNIGYSVYMGPAFELCLSNYSYNTHYKYIQYFDHYDYAPIFNDQAQDEGGAQLFKDSNVTFNAGFVVSYAKFLLDLRGTYSFGKDELYSFTSYNSLALSIGYRIK